MQSTFWRSNHALPSKPVLVFGDPEQFQRDLVKAEARVTKQLNARVSLKPSRGRVGTFGKTGSGGTHMIYKDWPEWWFDVQNWRN